MQHRTLFAVLTAFAMTGSASAQLTLDGLVDDLGAAVASDPIMPEPGEGGAGGNGPMDLKDLYVKDDGTFIHIAITVNTDLSINNWGKYKAFIKTDNGGSGGTSDPWGRAINSSASFSPQYVISCWLDGTPGVQLHKWNGSGWYEQGGAVTMAVSGNGNATSMPPFGGIEWRISRADLGNATTVQVQATCTGGGMGDNGQDTIPSETNATDWNTLTVLDNPTGPQTVPVTLSGVSME